MKNEKQIIDIVLPKERFVRPCENRKNLKIGIGMIVKDEEDVIEDCLKSINQDDVSKEVIIVDTGSKDKTQEIVWKYTKYIYNYDMRVVNFSRMRNKILEISRKLDLDYVLMIDADERIDEGLLFLLNEIINCNEFESQVPFALSLRNRIGGKIRSTHFVNRLIPVNGYKYVGNVHEHVKRKEKGRWISEEEVILLKGIGIEHIGYEEDIVKKKQKAERNLTLLEKDLRNKEVNKTYALFNLIQHYYSENQYDMACSYFFDFARSIKDYHKAFIQHGFIMGLSSLWYVKDLQAIRRWMKKMEEEGVKCREMFYLEALVDTQEGFFYEALSCIRMYRKLKENEIFRNITEDTMIPEKVDYLEKKILERSEMNG